MNDRFKFRIWDKIHNRFLCIDNQKRIIFDYEDKEIRILEDEENACWLHIPFDECIVLQCTGLKDKNSKLIYEGDILKGKKDMICSPLSSKMVDKVGVVEIPINTFIASCRDIKNNCTLFCQYDWVKTKVIGNIYENVELLEE